MSRWRSYRLWLAIAALIGMVLQDLGIITMLDRFEGYVNVILMILILLGIIRAPAEVPPVDLSNQEKKENQDNENQGDTERKGSEREDGE
ncbi:hypothetical protein [Pontibacillus marinus]|uniref:Holin n=1 Tax=Pontibacillus marinus BH030004 = DSM 16465 TaxID=1385511 RepID=A0A0A5HUW6_9BACI|nr:hypothetical protein [Pontibacillus marinus]KGX87422.1 hypothetical protein N783_09715 [Pontibacillus marinus BH030004 = DSM 16465]